MGTNTKIVTDASWATDVLDSEKPVLVDFWAEWCAPCRKVAPLLEEIAEEYAGRVIIAKVDIDANPGVARDYGVLSIPTLTVFKGGQAVQSVLGVQPKGILVKMVESAL